MRSFKNKIVVVTGAGAGIGRATALEFAKHGAKLALNDYRMENLQDIKGILDSLDVTYYLEAFDVSNKEAFERFADNVKKNLGAADVIVNNAGIPPSGENYLNDTYDDFSRVIDIDFWSVYYGTTFFTPQLLENNKEAAIVNVSSLWGLSGAPGHVSYATAKFAVRGFTESIAFELSKTKVSVHCVHPGGINTNIAVKDYEGKSITAPMLKEFGRAYLKTTPDEMAKIIVKGVQKKKFRILGGDKIFLTYFAVLLFPFKMLKGFILADFKNKGLGEVLKNKIYIRPTKL